jgi:hypothetical protein
LWFFGDFLAGFSLGFLMAATSDCQKNEVCFLRHERIRELLLPRFLSVFLPSVFELRVCYHLSYNKIIIIIFYLHLEGGAVELEGWAWPARAARLGNVGM